MTSTIESWLYAQELEDYSDPVLFFSHVDFIIYGTYYQWIVRAGNIITSIYSHKSFEIVKIIQSPKCQEDLISESPVF